MPMAARGLAPMARRANRRTPDAGGVPSQEAKYRAASGESRGTGRSGLRAGERYEEGRPTSTGGKGSTAGAGGANKSLRGRHGQYAIGVIP